MRQNTPASLLLFLMNLYGGLAYLVSAIFRSGMGLRTSVLIVEDSELFRRFLRLLLATPDIHILAEVATGGDALEKILELRPDLVLLDIHLPDMDGISVGRRIRQIAPEVKVVFVTEESSQEYLSAALSIGTAYVSKTCAGADLPSAITAVLRDETFISSALSGPGTFKSRSSGF